jgi:hypothetical protein
VTLNMLVLSTKHCAMKGGESGDNFALLTSELPSDKQLTLQSPYPLLRKYSLSVENEELKPGLLMKSEIAPHCSNEPCVSPVASHFTY